ncbi:MAG: hypothetical protein FWF59_00790 [Turicibacter sp.]|nr:hypothetical protein [Turicibacter sp.]
MEKSFMENHPGFIHDFIEILSQKAEEIKDAFGNFEGIDLENSHNFFEKAIFPDNDFRTMPMGGMTPPFLGPSGFNYSDEEECEFLYGFTNSEFIAFLGQLCPTEFLIIVSLITILITQTLNMDELSVIALFFEGLGDQLELLVEYDSIQADIKEAEEQKAHNKANQQDFEYIFQQLVIMQGQIKSLENQLAIAKGSDKSAHTPTPC